MKKSKYKRFYDVAWNKGYHSGYVKKKGIELTLFVYPVHDESVSYKLTAYNEDELMERINDLPDG